MNKNRKSALHKNRSLTLKLIFAAALLLVCAGVLIFLLPDKPRHVIIISLDTTRADHLGCYGNDWIKTPSIDKLADESILFENCITPAPSTLSSHASLFTGKYPHNHGTPQNGFSVNEKNVMLAEMLKQNNFKTIGFIGSFVLSSRFNIDQGFDHFDENIEMMAEKNKEPVNERSAEKVTDAVIEYFDKNRIPDNMFLFAHYFDPHAEYSAPPPYEKMYDREDEAVDALFQQEHAWRKLRRTGEENSFSRSGAARYAGEITYMDHHIGRLIDYLRHQGIFEESVVIVISDHGENFWHHKNYFNHGRTLFQTTMQSSCIIRLPGAHHKGTRIKQLISSIDIFPTLLNCFGLQPPDGIDGEAVDLFRETIDPGTRIRFCQATKPHNQVEDVSGWMNINKSRSICSGGLKFIQTPYEGTEELYNFLQDPEEKTNLLENPTPQISGMADSLRKKLEDWAASAKPLPSEFTAFQKEDTMERLKSLGYLQ